MTSREVTLFDSLDTCIAGIKSRYDSDWIITDALGGSLPGEFMNVEDFFDKVREPENHLFTEICICMKGSLAMQIGDRVLEVKAGEVCLILPEVLHAELPKKDSAYLAIWISLAFNTIAMHLSGKDKEDGFFYTLDGISIKSMVDSGPAIAFLKEELAKRNLYFLDAVKTRIIELLISILREMGSSDANKPENSSWKEEIVIQVRSYIEKNYYRSIRLSDISQELCISSNYINTIFKSVIGKTIIHYAEDLRIYKARELLRTSECSINSIAHALGYYDQYHFSKVFKKETGLTPTQFRSTEQRVIVK